MNMREKVHGLCAGLFAMVVAAGAIAWGDPLTGIVHSPNGKVPADYVPPMISNGRLNVFVDYQFLTLGLAREYVKKELQPGVWWEGRRSVDNNGKASFRGYSLFPQGGFQTMLSVDGRAAGAPVSWTQGLDVRRAICVVTNDFACGVRLVGEAFVPRARNLIAIRQTVTATDGTKEIELGIRYGAPSHPRILGEWVKEEAGAAWNMRAFGRFITNEKIAIVPGGFVPSVSFKDGKATLVTKLRLAKGESRTLDWFVTYEDDLSKSLPIINPVPLDEGPLPSYDALRAAHVADWERYFSASSIDVPDARIRAMSDMARYHLRCVTTEWSIPVGIIQSHWSGKIFAFDEMYAVQGLLASGQFECAKVAAEFRAATLRDACVRVGCGARWVWQGMEGNVIEGGRLGFWDDHIFHQAAIAQTVWSYYRYTDDLAWLKSKGYAVLRACALFFRKLSVQDLPDGTSFVTKCTDLERLGPGHERAFMTTCGVISTLRMAAEAADLVGEKESYAADFRACAERLVKSLPEKDGRYIAYPGCKDESMGTLAGFYPFRTFDRSNAAQVKAVRHFLDNGTAFGNMYATGRQVCPWYAATMAMAALRAGDAAHSPLRWIEEAYRSAGCWGEYWEINEPGVSQCRPWFMTAAGNCLYAIDQLFVADMEDALYLAPGVPSAWKDYAFRLPAPGGLTIDMAVKGGRVERLTITCAHPSAARKVRIVPPAGLGLAPQTVVLDRQTIAINLPN